MSFSRKSLLALVFAAAACNAAKPILTPALDAQISAVVKQYPLPGYAFAVIHPDGEIESRTWGNRTEDGAAFTTDVCPI
jgi:hypothetical protein